MLTMKEAFEASKNKKVQQIITKMKKVERERQKKVASIKKHIRNEIKRFETLEPLVSRMFLELKNDSNEYNKVVSYLKAFCKKADDDEVTYLKWDLEEVPTYWKKCTQEKIYRQIGVPV